MQIAVASGKGGTGKTTLSVALAQAAQTETIYLDCDVEEPNGIIFLKPEISQELPVNARVPVVNKNACTGCGACQELCQFNAIIALNDNALVFPELCHSCGGCARVCPNNAITEKPKQTGILRIGKTNHISVIEGILDIGNTMAPPVIRAVKKYAEKNKLTIIDAPPGTSCPMIAAVRGSDYVILVTEPTPFGFHDLKLAVETVRQLNTPFGVVVNRSDSGDRTVTEFCRNEQIPVLLEIPESRLIAEAYSKGTGMIEAAPDIAEKIRTLITDIESQYGDDK